MSEDLIAALLIGGAVLIYAIYVMRNTLPWQADFKKRDKRARQLETLRVSLAPTEEQVPQIVRILEQAGQSVADDQIDNWAYEDQDTWVLTAYVRKTLDVEGVMIAERIADQLHVKVYVVDQTLDDDAKHLVAKRLVDGLAWESIQAGLKLRPSLDAAVGDSGVSLGGLLDDAYSRYSATEVGSPPNL